MKTVWLASVLLGAVALVVIVSGIDLPGHGGVSDAIAADDSLVPAGVVKSLTGVAPLRLRYYPGTEAIGSEEMRLVALGTGMLLARRSQAATCW